MEWLWKHISFIPFSDAAFVAWIDVFRAPDTALSSLLPQAFAELTAVLKPLYPLLKGSNVTVYVRARCFAACGHAVT